MDKKTAGLIGVVAGLASMGSAPASAAPAPDLADAMHASSYADLLNPVPNAVAVLQADDAARAEVQRVNGYFYYNYGAPPPYAYGQPYYAPGYGPYYRGYYYHYHHHHHHHHHHHGWR